MVEGHSVHRVCHAHRAKLVGKAFAATSPNGRFEEGARAIDNRPLLRVEAYGKNLFYFFGEQGDIVMHVHFGMSGAFKLFDLGPKAPEPTSTTRLRLVHAESGVVAHLSAMTVDHGGLELYATKTAALGEDPLRTDADADRLWHKVSGSGKGIGALLMDQACFPGVGNIYRAEILFKAGVHPELVGRAVTRPQYDLIWNHSVELLRRGFQTGSILTVDPDEARCLGNPKLRRYVYNSRACPRCDSAILTWDINARKVYVCPRCQPIPAEHQTSAAGRARALAAAPAKLFESHCARDSADARRATPEKLSVAELRSALRAAGVAMSGKKADLVTRLRECDTAASSAAATAGTPRSTTGAAANDESPAAAAPSDQRQIPALELSHEPDVAAATAATALVAGCVRAPGTAGISQITSYAAAAAEKTAAGEGRNVEHVADMDFTLPARPAAEIPTAPHTPVTAPVRSTPPQSTRKRKSGVAAAPQNRDRMNHRSGESSPLGAKRKLLPAAATRSSRPD